MGNLGGWNYKFVNFFGISMNEIMFYISITSNIAQKQKLVLKHNINKQIVKQDRFIMD